MTTESLGEAIAAAGFAVFLLTEDRRVLFANAKAEDLIRRKIGLRFERGVLAAATPVLTARPHALAREGARPGRGEGDIAGTLELSRGENCLPLLAYVFPLTPNRAVSIFDIETPAAAVFVVDQTAGIGAQYSALRHDSGSLTPRHAFLRKSLVEMGLFPPPRARGHQSDGTEARGPDFRENQNRRPN